MGWRKSSDEELLNLYIKYSDYKYFQVLYERYIPLMYGLCLKYLKQEQDAQDAVVALYEDVSVKVKKYKIDNFKNWLYSVTKFYCFSLLKTDKKEILVDFNTVIMESELPDTLLEEKELQEEKLKAVEDCVEKLPFPQKVCIEAFFFQDKSYADIVEITDYNLKSVKSYIQNGRRNLKICLEGKNLFE